VDDHRGGFVRQLYVQEGKSQRQIASLLAISRTTVKKYCEGAQVSMGT